MNASNPGTRALVIAALFAAPFAGFAQELTRPPRLVHQEQPRLPEGFVIDEDTAVLLQVTIDEYGEVIRVDVDGSAGAALDWAAMGAATRLSFEPAEVDGVPAPVQINYRYTFAAQRPTPAAVEPPPPVLESPPPVVEEPDAGIAAPPPPAPASYAGVVLDENSEQPLPDVEVYIRLSDEESLDGTTDEQGRFLIRDVPPGRHMVAFTATGYEQLTTVEQFAPGEEVHAAYPLRQLGGTRFETVVRDRMYRPSRVSLVVGSVTAIGERQLRMTAPQSANEVLRGVPGVTVVDEDGSGLRSNIGFRGLDPNRSRKILVLEDGVPISIAPYGEPEGYYTPAIERMAGIEVAKGSDSILHGPQTIGGVLNYITADPPKKPTVVTEARIGTHGYWMGYLSAGNTHGPAGWRVDVVHRRFIGPRRLDLQLVDVNAKARLEFSPTSAASLKFGIYNEESSATYLGLTTPQYLHNPDDNFAIHDRFLIRRYSASVHQEHSFTPALRLKTLVYWHTIQRNWRRQDFERENTGNEYERIVPGTPDAAPDENGGTLYFRNLMVHRNRNYSVGGIEPRLSFTFSLGPVTNELLAGTRLHFEQAKEQRLDGLPGLLSGDVAEDEVRTGIALALFAQYRITFFESLRITPGFRIESLWAHRRLLRTRGIDENGQLTAIDVDIQERSPTFAIVPGLGVSYALLENLMFFAGVHRGFAPPRTKDAVSNSGENLRLAAELSWNWEAGTRFALGDFFSTEAALFYLDFQNQIIPPSEAGGATVVTDQTGARLVNGGRTWHMGVETSATIDFARLGGFDFQMPYTLSYTYVNARYASGVFEGHRLPYAPEHMVNGKVGFMHPLGFEAQLTGSYMSPQFTDNENTKNPSDDGTRGSLGRRLIIDGRVAYTFSPLGLTVYLSGKNITDYRYIASRAPQGIQPGMVRQVMVGVRGEL